MKQRSALLFLTLICILCIAQCTGISLAETISGHTDQCCTQMKSNQGSYAPSFSASGEKRNKPDTGRGKGLTLEREPIAEKAKELIQKWGEGQFADDPVLVRHAIYFFKFYAVVNQRHFHYGLEKSKSYFPDIRKVFSRYAIPDALAFSLVFVESGFEEKALSDKGALGMFQFMPETARQNGLNVSASCDERLDYRKSALACARYLKYHRELLGSHMAALASYHHGAGSMKRAMAEPAKKGMLWYESLYRHKELGDFSREYLPKCLGVAIAYSLLEEYGRDCFPVLSARSLKISTPVSVPRLYRSCPGLYALNPDLHGVGTITPYAGGKGYHLLTELAGANNLSHIQKKTIYSLAERKNLVKPHIPYTGNAFSQSRKKTYIQYVKQEPDISAQMGCHEDQVFGRVLGSPVTLPYVFQEGNNIRVIASIFGTTTKKITSLPENRFLLFRKPRPGDRIHLPGLAPTTLKIRGNARILGKTFDLSTKPGESLACFTGRVRFVVASCYKKTRWRMGANITPYLVQYWNKSKLPDQGIHASLPPGLSLTVYTDYLWRKMYAVNP